MLTEFKVRGCGSNNSVGVIRQSYGLGVYGPRSEVKEGDMVAACKCCPEVRYLSATVEWHGYERFVCEGDDPIDPADRDRTKYLTYTTNGAAQISDCSGATNHFKANAVQSWFIDPFTGLTNYSGPGTRNVSYLCGSGDTCSLTQKQGTCTISGDDPCTEAEETERTVTFTETLSEDYGMDDVATKVDQAVGRLDLYSETQGIPDGTVGFLENGSNHSIVRLSPAQNAYVSGACPGCPGQLNALWVETYNPTTRQWFVTKQYIYIKFKSRTEYKMYRKDLTTGEIKESEETDSGEKIIKADKLNEEVWVTVSSGNQFFLCGEGYKCSCSTMAGCEDTGRKIYKQSATTCSPLIGPDCQEYLSSTYTEMATGSVSGFGEVLDWDGEVQMSSTYSFSLDKTSAIQTTACPSSSVENTSETESGSDTTFARRGNPQTTTTLADYRRTVSNNSETQTGYKRQDYLDFGESACACQKTIQLRILSNPEDPESVLYGHQTSTCTTTIEGATITTTSSLNRTTSVPSGPSAAVTSSSTKTTVWENPDEGGGGGLETVSDETNYTNSAWLETGFNALGRYYVSKADVKKACEVKFTACETNQTILPFDQPVEYEVLLHSAIRTFNQKDPDNPILTWEVDNQRKNVSSKGGPETKSFSIDIPTPETDKTVAALAYSTCTVWKKPN